MHKIAHALRSSLVYVDRASGALSAGQARELAGSIRDTGVPIYVAVLPDDPAYGGERIFDRLRAAVARPGVYAVALGSSFGAASDASVVLPGHVSQALARQNLRRHHGDLPAVLDGFVADVAARTGGGGDHGDGYGDGSDFGGGFGDGGASEAASVTEVRRTLRGRTADDGETGVGRNLSFDT
ncbi:hypothetical protein [Streptomyces sp. NEAU-YJ-81]|uniref:hypothetical protein n=1 Tax=Streptomyces sp. NEAU-YJ-81 TaxID=2820288 RepID=UPI001ABD4550|nr:hypothetical protein [Streptomyces sp. NEAU-YJ-81]